jgi:phosphate starvation-inducible PhoH-like protein
MSRQRATRVRIKNNRKDNTYELSQALVNNYRACEEGPQQRKTWSIHDLKAIKPLTMAQEDLFHAFFSGSHVVGYGSAGTGKSYISLWLALTEVFNKTSPQKKIIIVRSNVPTREVGHLPGTVDEKLSVYETPYHDILENLIGKSSTYTDMKAAGLIEFIPTSFIRGQTWDNAIIILDEAQSCSWHELNSVITRTGENSRLLLLGDTKQDDLIYRKNDISGFPTVLRVFEQMESVAMVKFTTDDIVRSGFVKEWLMNCEQLGF